jgi:hypothetical protein
MITVGAVIVTAAANATRTWRARIKFPQFRVARSADGRRFDRVAVT